MTLISYEHAFDKLIQQLSATQKTELVPIEQVLGRVLAQPIIAQFNSPIFDNSAMDGYAICGLNEQHWTLTDYVAAGDSTQHIQMKAGEAVRVFTGAAIPVGTEAVIAQENVNIVNNTIICLASIKANQHIRFQAEEYAKNEVLINKNQCISATQIGVIASQGITKILCYQQLKVTVYSSGNELQTLDQELQENQIYDSNRAMLLSLLKNNPFIQYSDGGILPDDENTIQDQLMNAEKTSDVVLISGGASVGDKDYTKKVLEELGEIHHWKIAIKPGKPFAWGKINNTKVFVLPGNPVACWVTYFVLVLPALKILAGINQAYAIPKRIQAKAAFEIQKVQSRLQFLRGNLIIEECQLHVKIHPLQSSSMLVNCVNSNVLAIVPANEVIEYGQNIQVIYLDLI